MLSVGMDWMHAVRHDRRSICSHYKWTGNRRSLCRTGRGKKGIKLRNPIPRRCQQEKRGQKDARDGIFELLRRPGINSCSLCSLAGRYDNPIPTRFLAPIDCAKIPAQKKTQDRIGRGQQEARDLKGILHKMDLSRNLLRTGGSCKDFWINYRGE